MHLQELLAAGRALGHVLQHLRVPGLVRLEQIEEARDLVLTGILCVRREWAEGGQELDHRRRELDRRQRQAGYFVDADERTDADERALASRVGTGLELLL